MSFAGSRACSPDAFRKVLDVKVRELHSCILNEFEAYVAFASQQARTAQASTGDSAGSYDAQGSDSSRRSSMAREASITGQHQPLQPVQEVVPTAGQAHLSVPERRAFLPPIGAAPALHLEGTTPASSLAVEPLADSVQAQGGSMLLSVSTESPTTQDDSFDTCRVKVCHTGDVTSSSSSQDGTGPAIRFQADRASSISTDISTSLPQGGKDKSFSQAQQKSALNMRETDEVDDLEPHSAWAFLRRTSVGSTASGGAFQLSDFVNYDEDDDDDLEAISSQSTCTRLFNRIVLVPNAGMRLRWDLLGFALIAYDAVVIPLQFLDIEEGSAMLAMAWVTRVYWTLDLFCSCITGYVNHQGKILLRFTDILQHYARTWMIFDVAIVCFDWVELLASDSGNSAVGAAGADIAKSVRTVRVLRMLRLLRLMRLAMNANEVASSFTYRIRSEELLIYVGIGRIMVVVICIAHFIACVWYGIGANIKSYGTSWVEMRDLQEASVGSRYVSSFAWSLNQFTGTGDDIQPSNSFERTFAIVIMMFAFVVSACVISSITTQFTRLQIIRARDSEQIRVLQQYLVDSGISRQLASRVMRNATHAIKEQKRNMPEKSVELLTLLSQPLHVEMRWEVHGPVLRWHPFFSKYSQLNAAAMRQVCYAAVSRLSLMQGDVLLTDGEMPDNPQMFFVLGGTLLYILDGRKPHRFLEGHWANEPVLWAPWVHRGLLRASMDTSLLCLDAKQFQVIARQFRTENFYPAHYAAEFVAQLNEEGGRPYYEVNVQQIAQSIFPAHELSRSSVSSMGSAGLISKFSHHIEAATRGSGSGQLGGRGRSSSMLEKFSFRPGAPSIRAQSVVSGQEAGAGTGKLSVQDSTFAKLSMLRNSSGQPTSSGRTSSWVQVAPVRASEGSFISHSPSRTSDMPVAAQRSSSVAHSSPSASSWVEPRLSGLSRPSAAAAVAR